MAFLFFIPSASVNKISVALMLIVLIITMLLWCTYVIYMWYLIGCNFLGICFAHPRSGECQKADEWKRWRIKRTEIGTKQHKSEWIVTYSWYAYLLQWVMFDYPVSPISLHIFMHGILVCFFYETVANKSQFCINEGIWLANGFV